MKATLDRCCEVIGHHVHADTVTIRMLNDSGRLEEVATWGLGNAPKRAAQSRRERTPGCVCTQVLRGHIGPAAPYFTRSGSFCAGAQTDAQRAFATTCLSNDGCVCRRGNPESLLLVPLRSMGRSVGLVQVTTGKTNAFDDHTVEYVERLSVEIGAAVENISVTAARDVMNAQLTAVTESIADCIDRVSQTQQFDHRIENPHLVRCWQARGCDKRECPAHESEDLRCWLTEGVLCDEHTEGGVRHNGGPCERCEVYLQARPDRYSEITEGFNSMLVTLKRKADRVMWLERKMIGSEKLSALGELVSGVAHELNNPLAVVLGFAQALLADPRCPARIKADLQQIDDAADRCRRIVTNLLDFSRRHEPDKQASDVNAIILRAVGMLEHAFRDSGIEVELALAFDLPSTSTDPHQLERVFFNIAQNAHQALTNAGSKAGKTGRFSVRSAVLPDGSDRWLRVEFEDNGPGMSAEHRRRVFEPFFTTKPVGQGTGLGLSIAYGIIQSLGGELRLDSELGRGTRLTIDLPVVAVEEEHEETQSRDEDEDLTGLSILVVDDEDSVREVVDRILGMLGARVAVAHDGKSGADAVRDSDYDCILLDVRMAGGLDGFATYDLMRCARPTIERKVVFMSGDTMNARLREFAGKHGCGIVAKPFTLPSLVAEVRNAANAAPPSDASPCAANGARKP